MIASGRNGGLSPLLGGWLLLASLLPLSSSSSFVPHFQSGTGTWLSPSVTVTQRLRTSNAFVIIRNEGNDLHSNLARVSTSLQASSSSSSSSSSTTKSTKTKRTTSTKKRKGKYRPPKTRASGRALTEKELVDHVATKYLEDRRGPLDEVSLRRGMCAGVTDASYTKYLGKLNRSPALALNADYQPLGYLPLSLWSWQDAVKAVFSGKVTVVDVYPGLFIRSPNMIEIPVPSVIALNEYVSNAEQKRRPAFTRRNVFLRDEYRCQYCSQQFHTADLSLDHVHPRCMGGVLSWENAVTCCLKCNGKKGSLTTEQLRRVGMKLVRPPFVPSQFELATRASRMVSGNTKRFHSSWIPYLGLDFDSEEDEECDVEMDYFKP